MQINLNISRKIFNDVYYPELYNYSTKMNVYYGGSGSGKSVFICQKLLIKALTYKRTILVVRKTLSSQFRSCWKLFLDTLEQFKLTEYCNINISNYQIELPNKSMIYFAGIDNPERIKSIVGITDCFMEECTELSLDDFSQLKLRVRANCTPGIQFYCAFNPISKANYVYNLWFSENADLTDTKIIKTTYKDNKFLPQDYIDNLERMINSNPTYYKIYALGEFCTLDKLVFNNWEVKEFDNTKIQGELLCGLDFGYVNDLTAFSASILDENNKCLYIFKEWCDKGKTNNEISDIIKSMGFSKSQIICDSAEPKSIEELRRNGLVRVKASVKGKDSILNGIQKMQQYKIIVHPSCTNTITEFENYSWKKDKQTNEYINEPVDNFNHSIDSIRYSIQCVGKGRLNSISKNVLGL